MNDRQELDWGPPREGTAGPARILDWGSLNPAVCPPAPTESAQQHRVLDEPDGSGKLALPCLELLKAAPKNKKQIPNTVLSLKMDPKK